MNKLSILCLIMLVLTYLGTIGAIVNSLWVFVAIFQALAIIFAGLFGITLKKR